MSYISNTHSLDIGRKLNAQKLNAKMHRKRPEYLL